MRPLRAIVQARLRDLKLPQKAFAEAIGLPPPYLSDMLHGRQPLGSQRRRAAEWCRVLDLGGEAADELTMALLLHDADPEIRAVIDRLERENQEARRLLPSCAARLAEIARIASAVVADLERFFR